MRVRFSGKDLSQLDADLAVCFAYEGDTTPRGVQDLRLRRELGSQMKAEGFKGKPGDRLVWNTNGRYASRRFLVIGLGSRDRNLPDLLRQACSRATAAGPGFSAMRLGIRLPDLGDDETDEGIRAATEGSVLGAYHFDRYLTVAERKPTRLASIELSADGPAPRLRKAMARGAGTAGAVCLARDLVNDAPSRMNPRAMARVAVREARVSGLKCKVFERAELSRMGLEALLAVARGAAEAPRVVHLSYKPSGKSRGRVLLVGKGVTFDSGGLNLKPGDSMLTMKADMAGAAAVLAAMTALPKLGCKAEVHAYLGLVENMTGPAAYKPGDVLRTYSGKTVEVGNTDAEGRLVLCDLLAYGAAKHKPAQVVDLATLTGACVVALGPMASGLFCRHDALRESLLAAAGEAGEKMWPMPMYDEYLQLLQKGPADLRNVGGRWGGAITAALFLGEFLPREVPWAHLDIAGPAFGDQDLADWPQGATGAGVATLVRWLERQ